MSATRWTTVLAGDTLRIIALRELNDALRWGEIARLNELRPPYISPTADPDERQRATLIWGERIAVPKGTEGGARPTTTDLYGLDVALERRGYLDVDASGDWATASGPDNLLAALARRIEIPTGDLIPHPSYGCDVRNILGFRLTEIAMLLGGGYVSEALKADPRISRIDKLVYDADGDVVRYAARVVPIDGEPPVELNFVFPVTL
jgi:hypothetical protein